MRTRVRSSSQYLELVMYEASARSQTFRHLVEEIEHSDGIVYVEPGTCRHGVGSCLSMTLVQTGGFRMLQVLVNPTGSPWGLTEFVKIGRVRNVHAPVDGITSCQLHDLRTAQSIVRIPQNL